MIDFSEMAAWPILPYDGWEPTKQTLHRYSQIVGKVRMSLVPFRNHWWHVSLYVSARGLTTGPMPHNEKTVEVAFDVLDHRLVVQTSDGQTAGFALEDRLSCATFYSQLFAALREVGVEVSIRPEPFDLGDSPAFPDDAGIRAYDPEPVERWWSILRLTDQVLGRFASRFSGKASPPQLFWHSFDLAHSRFSGRTAPAVAGADRVSAEAYSHELISFGWWPGDDRRTPYPAFYSYTSPEPPGLRDRELQPAQAQWHDTGNGSLALLAYEAVRTSTNPAETLLGFYESAYRAGATLSGWDSAALDSGRR